ncbi:hypothetical protein ACNF42_05660 [Cuniculiplasma sp. SKW3]|uniref:hypothetical protein n=1 Tax=Cuniculiplasma sp. SKW3 TaxID=3400170 RepID=UPI003FCF2CE7
MLPPESSRIEFLISEVEKVSDSKFFIVVSDVLKNSGFKSVDLCLDLLEENLIKQVNPEVQSKEIFVGLYGGAHFSSSSLMRMKFLIEKYAIKMMPVGDLSSLFSAFVKIGITKGNQDLYKEIGIKYFNVPLEDLVADFEEKTSHISFFPLSQEDINSIIMGNISKSGAVSNMSGKSLKFYSQSKAFLSYVDSIKIKFRLGDEILGNEYGLGESVFTDIRYDPFGNDPSLIINYLKQINESITLFKSSIEQPFIGLFSSEFIKYSSKDSGVWND